ncbi:MAG TPA: DUF2079 domain-containing protein [Polyangiaceae bacterium]
MPKPAEPGSRSLDARPKQAPVETQLVVSIALLFLVGASLGGAVALFGLTNRTEFVTFNALEKDARTALLKLMAASGAGFVLLGVPFVGYLAVLRLGRVAIGHLERFAKLCSPLIAVFFVPLLFDWRVFQAHDLTFVVLATSFGLGLERLLRVFFEVFPWPWAQALNRRLSRRLPRFAPRVPALVAGGMTLSFCAYMSYFTVLQHLRLGTMSWDMAIFDNLMWNLIRGEWFKASPVLGPEGSHIQYHATFIAYVFAPFYALYQHPQTLLVLQATLAGLGAIPLYLVARRRLGNGWAALPFVYAYLVHGPLHGPIFYDFHFITTAPFWVGWVIYFFESNRKWLLLLSFFLALLVREEVSASLSMVALFYVLSGQRARWALLGGLLAVLYFVAIKFVVMPMHATGADKQTFSWIFFGLIAPGEEGLTGVVKTIVSNPAFTITTLFEADKLVYFLKTFGPLLLLPVRHRLTWLFFVPAWLFTLLTTGYAPVIATSFQYTSNYTPYLFFAAVVAVSSWTEPELKFRRIATMTALVVTATVFSFQHGAIFQRNTFRGGFQLVRFERTPDDKKRYRDLHELIRKIPPRASVCATEWEVSHVSNRPDAFTMRFATWDADYLLANLDEASWGPSRTNLLAALSTGKYGFIASRGRFALWGKGAKHDRDEEGAKLLGVSPAEVGIKPKEEPAK